MRRRSAIWPAVLALAGSAQAAPTPGEAGTAAAGGVTRYSVAGGCYALRSPARGKLVTKNGDG